MKVHVPHLHLPSSCATSRLAWAARPEKAARSKRGHGLGNGLDHEAIALNIGLHLLLEASEGLQRRVVAPSHLAGLATPALRISSPACSQKVRYCEL